MPHEQQQNAGRIGRVSEHLAAAWILMHGDVYVATMPDPSNCDLIVMWPDGSSRSVQVKTAYMSSRGMQMANCASSRGDQYDGIDYLLIVDQQVFMFWLVPVGAIHERSHMRMGRYGTYAHAITDEPRWLAV